MTPIEQAAVRLLRAIVEEVAGPSKPYSADSYLPAHLIFDARSVIEDFDRQMPNPADPVLISAGLAASSDGVEIYKQWLAGLTAEQKAQIKSQHAAWSIREKTCRRGD